MDATREHQRAARGSGRRRREPTAPRAGARAPISTSGSGTSCRRRCTGRRAVASGGRRAAAAMSVAPHRVGEPSPLIFHLGAALSAYGQALLAAPRADSASFPWAPALGVDRAALGRARPDRGRPRDRRAARGDDGRARDLAGASLSPRPSTIRRRSGRPAARGCSTMARRPGSAGRDGPPVLVVPSLINRAYILDLAPGRSMLRWLAAQGLRPLLLDWGSPGPAEAGFDLGGYGERTAAAGAGRGAAARRAAGAGGGLLHGRHARGRARGAARRRRSRRWSPSARPGTSPRPRASPAGSGRCCGPTAAARAERLLDGLGEAFGMVPVSVFQTLFALVNPIAGGAEVPEAGAPRPGRRRRRALFVAIEDWLADGVPMPVGAAQRPAGRLANPQPAGGGRLALSRRRASIRGGSTAPALVFCGETDNIAPPALARPLAAALPGARLPRPAHRARRDGRRQRRACPGVASVGGFPRRPSRLSLPVIFVRRGTGRRAGGCEFVACSRGVDGRSAAKEGET